MAYSTLPKRRYQAAIAGRVLDARSQAVVPGVTISITAMPAAFQSQLENVVARYGAAWASMTERADRTTSASDGVFHFGDLPDGQYTLSFSIPHGDARYGTTTTAVTVSHDAEGTVTTGLITVNLPPTGVEGQILLDATASGSSTTPLAMARVYVRGSGQSAYSNAGGKFYVTGADPGPQVLMVSAPGYASASTTVTIETGVVTSAPTVTLIPSP
ncbi:hypothetical protein A7982_13838 [Minicystis rosea]|nr:hypothetical protein A7982_13838 [Minicystis rosea]